MEAKYGRLFTEQDLRLLMSGFGDRVTEACVRAATTGQKVKAGWARGLMEQVIAEDSELLTFPPDEPLFLLRGQDKATPDAISSYWDVCAGYGDLHDPQRDDDQLTSDEHLAAVKAVGEGIEAWQREHPDRVKIPD